MNRRPPTPATAPRFDARVLDAAKQRAHQLRDEAIDGALRSLGRWLVRPFAAPRLQLEQELPCHS